jgi:hypothetical protein
VSQALIRRRAYHALRWAFAWSLLGLAVGPAWILAYLAAALPAYHPQLEQFIDLGGVVVQASAGAVAVCLIPVSAYVFRHSVLVVRATVMLLLLGSLAYAFAPLFIYVDVGLAIQVHQAGQGTLLLAAGLALLGRRRVAEEFRGGTGVVRTWA